MTGLWIEAFGCDFSSPAVDRLFIADGLAGRAVTARGKLAQMLVVAADYSYYEGEDEPLHH